MLSASLILAVALASSAPYAVVLVDGSVIQAMTEPETRGPVVVATLTDGTPVSIATAKVDWSATELANRPEVVAQRAARAAGPRPRRILIDNRAIERRRRDPKAVSPPAATDGEGESIAAAEPAGPALPVARASDPERRPAEYWRERARELRDRDRRATRELVAAEASYARERDAAIYGRTVSSADGTLRVVEYTQSDEERAVRTNLLAVFAAEVDRARAGVAEVAAAEAELHEEARIARADPGWLRGP